MSQLTLVHVGDVHFGAYVDLRQIAALERLVPEVRPDAIAVSGDITQRARHGEFQRALALVESFRRTAPTLVVPGNHDTTWWRSPFDLLGTGPKHAKYRRYFSGDLGPVVERPGLIMVGAVTAHGLAAGSVTWNLRDLTVKGHLPRAETDRARNAFTRAPAAAARVLVFHHNVLRGEISRRMGLAHWRDAHRRVAASGADLVLCGHDHQESAGEIDGVVVAAAGTHSSMSRGGRPSVFNLIEITERDLTIRFMRWDQGEGKFRPDELRRFQRAVRQA